MNRWCTSGVLDRVFTELQRAQIARITIETVSLDSTSVKVHPDGTGALKKTVRKPSASPAEGAITKFIWLPRIDRTAVIFALSPGQAHDAPQGRALLCQLGTIQGNVHLLTDRAYEGNETRQLAQELGFIFHRKVKTTDFQPVSFSRANWLARNSHWSWQGLVFIFSARRGGGGIQSPAPRANSPALAGCCCFLVMMKNDFCAYPA